MADISVVRGNTGLVVSATLKRNGAVLDLGVGTTVRFIATVAGTKFIRVNGACVIVGDGSTGQVTYALTLADVSKTGLYDAQFVVTGPADRNLNVPNNRFLSYQVLTNLP